MSKSAAHVYSVGDIPQVVIGAKVIGFDLDNTLARSKKPMYADMAQAFSQLTTRIPMAVITGGSFELVRTQVLDVLDREARRDWLHIMPASGTSYYLWDGSNWRCQYAHDLSHEERDQAVRSLERHAKAQDIWLDHVWGERIEDRGGQITFSALGQHAPVECKEAWDPTHEKKNRLASAVSRDLPWLAVRSGGSTSVDISQRGIDKAYAVRQLATMLDIDTEQIVFIGDRMDPDGNDYPAVGAGVRPIRVTGPADTLEVCTRLLDILPVDHMPSAR